MRVKVIAAVLAALAVLLSGPSGAGGRAAASAAGPARATQDRQAKVREILADKTLWGGDFESVLASLKDWGESGRREIVVFVGEAVESIKIPSSEAAAVVQVSPAEQFAKARERATALRSLMSVNEPKFNAQFEQQIGENAAAQLKTVRPTAFPSKDGQPAVVALEKTTGTAQNLAQGLTLSAVAERHGAPEQITYRRIDAGDERRPLVLTLHHYAGGAIMFAESNMTPRGAVERVILDVPKVSRAIF